MTSDKDRENGRLSTHLSQTAAWAFAVGTSVGWGSLVVTGSNFLSQAGPLGSTVGILIGAVLMLIISRNFHLLANRYKSAGGIYTYTKKVFGYDRAFLVSWFLSLTYISMFWANATSFPLFLRYFAGDVFRFGYLYSFMGYEVYLGEVLITAAVVAVVTGLCLYAKRFIAAIMTGLVIVFAAGITVCFVIGMTRHGADMSFSPAFIPGQKNFSQVLRVILISPWAFIGFESVTYASEEAKYKSRKLFKILSLSVVTTTAVYVFIMLLSVSAYPAEYGSWLDYLRDLPNLGGIKGLPAFYAASVYMGRWGVYILYAALFSLIVTSLIGNMHAISRLFYALSKDEILPAALGRLNKKGIPGNAMLSVAALSAVIPLLGRVAIGWIVDITTLGAALIYGFASAAAYKVAKNLGRTVEKITGAAGFIIMVGLGVYLLLPELFSGSILNTETYLLLIVWSLLGFIYFRRIIAKDHARRYGKAIIVWISILSLVVLMAIVWTNRTDESATEKAIISVQEYYNKTADPETLKIPEEEFIASVREKVHKTDTVNTVIVAGLFVLSLGVMLSNHFTIRKWENKAVMERDSAREIAYRDPLTGVKSKNAYIETENEQNDRIAAGTAEPFGLAVCDVNGLKAINDTKGHKAGDEYIRLSGRLICGYFKHSPVFRVGGDEFVVLLTGTDYDKCDKILAEVNRVIEDNIGTDEAVVSIGVSKFDPENDANIHAVFERADALMYERKQQLKAMGAKTRE